MMIGSLKTQFVRCWSSWERFAPGEGLKEGNHQGATTRAPSSTPCQLVLTYIDSVSLYFQDNSIVGHEDTNSPAPKRATRYSEQ